jgi:serine/threonine protein phosphatase PrpC
MEPREGDAAGSLVLLGQEMPRPRVLAFAGGSAACYSTPCPGAGARNEDGLALLPLDHERGVLAVADGLGGQPGGDRAARIALECLADSVRRAAAGKGYLRESILDGIEEANREVRALGIGAGTTLALVEIRGEALRAYHVGDSEILVVGQRGRVRYRSVPHSPVGYGVEAGLIDRREALGHEERYLLSNLVGSPEMRIEIGPVMRLRPRDVVLLATDGLHDNLHDGEVVELVRKGPLGRSAAGLVERGGSRMTCPSQGEPSKPDDLSFILFRRTRL